MGVIYTDRIPMSKRVGGQLNLAAVEGIITDAIVSGNATITLVKAALLTPTYNQTKMKSDTSLALDMGLDLGVFSETHGVSTVAALVALTDASTTHRQAFFG